jgi:CBS-domain-containing membrane protein
MPHEKRVVDLMIPLTDFPHIPYWFTIKQAIAIVKKTALGLEGQGEHATLLVFDEKYRLMGTLTMAELTRGIEKRFVRSNGTLSEESDTPVFFERLFTEGIKEEAQKPVSEIMSPVKESVTPEDSIIKAIYIMRGKNLALLPVIENDVLQGIIRPSEIFNELAELILAE